MEIYYIEVSISRQFLSTLSCVEILSFSVSNHLFLPAFPLPYWFVLRPAISTQSMQLVLQDAAQPRRLGESFTE